MIIINPSPVNVLLITYIPNKLVLRDEGAEIFLFSLSVNEPHCQLSYQYEDA